MNFLHLMEAWLRVAKFRCFLFFLVTFLLTPFAGGGTFPERPRIGLALQGGGAKGFAHIGILQWLEENRIPADMIAGTSMGGLIGGFYASGMSVADLKRLIARLNWDELIGGQPPYSILDFRRKEDRRDYPNQLEFGLKNGFGLPSGLNSGHAIGLILDRVTLPYYELGSFDELPTPFRCVAVDLVSEQEVVFSHGSLSDALRATMSLPAVFSPLRRDGKVYADGGMVNNLPVDVAKAMGADFVIAVHLDVGAYDPKNLQSLTGVLSRSIDVMMDANLSRSLQLADLVVPVDVRDFSTLDFKAGEAIIRKGYEAAAAMSAQLSKWALTEEEWNRYLSNRKSRIKTEIPIPRFIEVEGVSPVLADNIRRNLQGLSGSSLDADRLEKEINAIWGRGRYAAVGYGLIKRDGRAGLLIRPEEKQNSPPKLNLKLNIDGSDVGLIRFGLGARLTMLDLWGYRSEWRTDFEFGSKNLIATEYYWAVAQNAHWFLAPRAYAGNSILDIYHKGDRVSEYRAATSGLGVDTGYRFNRSTELRIGQDMEWSKAHLRTGSAEIRNYNHFAGVSALTIRHLGQDDAVVPRQGIRAETRGEWFSSRPYQGSGFPRAEAKFSWFQPVSQRGSVFLAGSGGTAFGRDSLGLLSYSLGGVLQLGSYGKNELLGNQYFLLTAGYLHEIASLPSLIGREIYAGGWYQAGKMYGDTDLPRHPMDLSAGLGAKTVLGPVFLGGSWGDAGHRKFYFGVGALF